MRRRDFIKVIGGGAAAWALVARAQPAMPVVGFINGFSADASTRYVTAFRKGLSETGHVEGQNVAVEYHFLEGQYNRLQGTDGRSGPPTGERDRHSGQRRNRTRCQSCNGDHSDRLRRRRRPGPAWSCRQPRPAGRQCDRRQFFIAELLAKRLRLLHDMVPKAVRIAVLLNPDNASIAETTSREAQAAAATIGLQIQFINATTISEIDVAFASLARERADALFVAPDGFFTSRAVQFATLAARDRMPATFSNPAYVAVGGLMSYGTDVVDACRQVGVYTGSILKGAKPADLPVLQSTKFVFAINLQTARALNIEVPPGLLAIADEVIE